MLFIGVGAGLAGPLTAVTELGWWGAAGCVAVAGAGLGLGTSAYDRIERVGTSPPARRAGRAGRG
jgi:hypothetical protein